MSDTPRRLFALIKGLPADAALWRLHDYSEHLTPMQKAQQKFQNVVSMEDFVASHQSHLKLV